MLGGPIRPAKEARYQAFSATREMQGLTDLWLFFNWHGDPIGMKAHATGKLLIQRLMAQQPVLVSTISDANADAVPQVVFGVARHVDRMPPPLWSLVVVGSHSAARESLRSELGLSKIRRILNGLPRNLEGNLAHPPGGRFKCAENFVLVGPARYALPSMAPLGPGRPGIAKTRELPLIQRRVVELWQSNDYRWRELFAAADVMSEGATRKDADGAVYYGSTSIVLTLGSRDAADADKLVRALSKDPHVRLRAVRIACLEAQLRATGAIGRVHSEFRVKPHEGGACIDVDVHANVFSDLTHTPAKTKAPFAKLPKRKAPGTRR